MNRRRIKWIGGLTVSVILVLTVAYLVGLNRWSSLPNVDAAKLFSASQSYRRQLEARGASVPESVSVAQLVQAGFLAPEDVRGFKNYQATVFLNADETTPDEVLVRLRGRNGYIAEVMGDGSVQIRGE